MAIEQPVPQGPRVEPIELEAPTKSELCSVGAVKLTHQQLAELKASLQSYQAELKVERQRNENLTARAVSAETNVRVLKGRLKDAKNIALKVRLVEVLMLILLHYLSEALFIGESVRAGALALGCLICVALIILIQKGAPSGDEL